MDDICHEPCNGPLPVNGNCSIDTISTMKLNPGSGPKSSMMTFQHMNSLLLRPLTWTANCVGSEKRSRARFNPSRTRLGSFGSIPSTGQSVSTSPLKPPSPLPQVASDQDASSISGYNFHGTLMHDKCEEPYQILVPRDSDVGLAHNVKGIESPYPNVICFGTHIDDSCSSGLRSQHRMMEEPCFSPRSLSPAVRSGFIQESDRLKCEEHLSTYLGSLKRIDFDCDDSSSFLPPGPITPSWPVTHITRHIALESNPDFQSRKDRDFIVPSREQLERTLLNYDAIQRRCKARLILRMVTQIWKSTISKKISDHGKLRLAAYKSRLISLHFAFQRIMMYANDRAIASLLKRRLDIRKESRLKRNTFSSWRRLSREKHHRTNARESYLELEAENKDMLCLLDKHKRLSSHQRGLIDSLRHRLESTEHELGNTVLQQRHVIDEMSLRSVCDAKVAKSLQRKMLADADEIRRLKRENALLQAQLQAARGAQASLPIAE